MTLHLLSLSTIVTVVLPGSPTVTLLGNEDALTVRLNVSLPSNILSLLIETLNEARISPALN